MPFAGLRPAVILLATLALSLPAAAQTPSCGTAAPAPPTLGLPVDDAPAARQLGTRPTPLAGTWRPRPVTESLQAPTHRRPTCVPGPRQARAGERPLLESDVLLTLEEGVWSEVSRGLYTYDAADSLTQVTVQVRVDGTWQDDWAEGWAYDALGRQTEHSFLDHAFGTSGWRERYTYDAEGRLTETLYQVLGGIGGGDEWADDSRYVFAYDGDRVVGTTTSYWDGFMGAWTESAWETMTYDLEGRLTSHLTEVIDPMSQVRTPLSRSTWVYEADRHTWTIERYVEGEWTNDTRDVRAVDLAGRATEMLGQYWADGAWQDRMRVLIEYHGGTDLQTYQEARWWGGSDEEPTGDGWADGWRAYWEYDANDRLTHHTYLRGQGLTEWVNVVREARTYNGNGLATLTQEGDDGAGGWVNRYLQTNTYDVNHGQVAESFESEWEGEEWVTRWRTAFHYAGAVSAEGGTPTAAGLTVYPNPASTFTIELTLPRPEAVVLDVVDVLGRRVDRLVPEAGAVGAQRVRWQPRHLAPGLYFVRLQAGERVETRPVTVVR